MTPPSFSGAGAQDAREIPVARRIRARDAVRAALAGVRPLVSEAHEGLTLLILEPRAFERRPGGESGTNRRWLTFAEAAQRGAVRVQEAPTASVPSVIAEADGVDVLLLDGDTIVGGLQNRIVNVSIWLKAGVPTHIPVSCLEQGRWRDGHDTGTGRRGGRDFSAGQRADPSLRAMVGAAVNAGVGMDRGPTMADRHGRGEAGGRSSPDAFAADQHGVWLEIEARQQRARVRSTTSALHDLWATEGGDRGAASRAFALPSGATGVAVGLFDRVFAVDLFDDPLVLAAEWPRLVDGAVAAWLDRRRAITSRAVRPPVRRHPDPGALGRLLRRAGDALDDAAVVKSVGAGLDVRIDGPRVHGAALVVDDRPVHVALFRREAEPVDRAGLR